MIDDGILIVSARSLTIFRQRIQRLIDQFDVILVDIISQQTEKTRLRAADRIEKFQRFADEIVIRFVIILQSEVILQREENKCQKSRIQSRVEPEIPRCDSRKAIEEIEESVS